MKGDFKPEKRQRFSLRKLSIGLVSATIGSFILLFTDGHQQVVADQVSNQEFQIDYHYVAESELTAQEKALLIKQLPSLADVNEQAYYLVYRPTGVLPNTGEQQLAEGVGVLAGASLLVASIAVNRRGKKYVKAFYLLTVAGVSVLSSSALALTNDVLASYNQSLQVRAGEQLPAPITIKGYTYLGYIKSSQLSQARNTDSRVFTDKPAPAALQGQHEVQTRPADKVGAKVEETSKEPANPADLEKEMPALPSQPDPAISQPKEEAAPAFEEAETPKSNEHVTSKVEENSPVTPAEEKSEKDADTASSVPTDKPEIPEEHPASSSDEKPSEPSVVPVVPSKPAEGDATPPEVSPSPIQPQLETPKEDKGKVENHQEPSLVVPAPVTPVPTDKLEIPEEHPASSSDEKPSEPSVVPVVPSKPAGDAATPTEVSPSPVQPQLETPKEDKGKVEKDNETLVKEKPAVTVEKITTEPAQHTATVSYQIVDQSQTLLGVKIQVFQGDQLVKEVALSDKQSQVVIPNLDYYTEYTLKTIVLYNLGEGEKRDELGNPAKVRLDYKKLEFKDINGVELYKKEKDGYHHKLSLDQVPTDLEQYFVKLKSSSQKESLLPIAGVVKEEKDGRTLYKVTVDLPELVQDTGKSYQEHFHFYMESRPKAENGVYTSFAALVDAMKANLAGTFRLGADLSADEVSLSDEAISYVPGEFTGKLIGRTGEQSYAIYHLKKPLFEHLAGATVQHLDLKSVDVTSDQDAASLAQTASASRIEDVSVQGQLKGYQNLAGLVATAVDSQFVNTSFTGNLTAAQLEKGNFLIGGLVAGISGTKARIEKSESLVDIRVTTADTEQVVGGLVGQAQNGAVLKDSYARGSIQHSSDHDFSGALLGSVTGKVTLENLIADMDMAEEEPVIGNSSQEMLVKNLVTTRASDNETDKDISVIDVEQADQKIAKLGITTSLEDSSLVAQKNTYKVDYSHLPGARAERQLAYENIAKLLPFYNKELVLDYGNKLDAKDELVSKSLVSVTAFADDKPVTDFSSQKQAINRLLLHFTDGSTSYRSVSYKGEFAQTGVVEYSIQGSELLYTPDHVFGSYDTILTSLLPSLQAVDFHSQEVADVLGVEKGDNLNGLYLEKAFEDTKKILATELPKVLSMDKAINSRGRAVADYILDKIDGHKAGFLLGLSYLNRWYNVNYGTMNAKDLLIYKLDFFGNTATSVIDTIIALGESGFENLKPSNNVQTFGLSLANEVGQTDLFAYLEDYRKIFLPDKTNNEWLKENTKAYIQERKSNIPEVRALQDKADAFDKHSVGVYDRITSTDWEYRNMLLPILTMPEKGVFIISNLSTLDFGSYERYKDKKADGTVYTGEELAKHVEELVDQAADYQRDHFDFWYKMLNPEDRENLFRKVLVYDGFKFVNNKGEAEWVSLEDMASSIQNFFGPVGKWYERDEEAGAYATGYETHFVEDGMLGDSGTSTFTHEMVHNSDEHVYFKGYGRRNGLGAEFYAYGLLQSSMDMRDQNLTINTFITGKDEDKDNPTRMQVLKPTERFKTNKDLQEYVHGMMDAVYLLDYLEGNSIVKQDDHFKKTWLRKIENYVRADKYGQPSYAGNQVRAYTDEEIAKIKTFTDLIDQDALVRRENESFEGKQEWNGYYMINLFDTIFAGLSNPEGTPGDITFRRTAYELLADKGYYEGFLPYVSGQYGAEALKAGKKTYSEDNEEEVGLVTDNMVLEKVYHGKYKTFADFKKAMYQERINKLPKLKPFTITYKLNEPESTEQVTITSYEQLQDLMDQAMALDGTKIGTTTQFASSSWVHHLKAQVYNALLRSTDDFKESIFEK